MPCLSAFAVQGRRQGRYLFPKSHLHKPSTASCCKFRRCFYASSRRKGEGGEDGDNGDNGDDLSSLALASPEWYKDNDEFAPPPSWDFISSKKSNVVKFFKLLQSKRRKREEENLAILEGHRLVIDTLRQDSIRCLYRHVLVSQRALQQSELGSTLHQLLLNSSSNDDYRISLATDQVLQAASDTLTSQGVVAAVAIPPPYKGPPQKDNADSTRPLLDKTPPPPTTTTTRNRLYVVLDGISDPGNLGTLLRSSAAVGVEAVLLLPQCCDAWNPKAVRSAMGATFSVPLCSFASFQECLDFLQQSCGVSLTHRFFAATMDTGKEEEDGEEAHSSSSSSFAHYEIDWVGAHNDNNAEGSPAAICIGGEGTGLSLPVRQAVADGRIASLYVPMEVGRIESLNAAVCGSIILFECHRQQQLWKRSRSKS